jgi:four helix bundle protein
MAYIDIHDMEIYKLSRKLSSMAWAIYVSLPQYLKFHMGDQLLRASDSVGANLTEGYFRYTYKDKNKFYVIARASHGEAFKHWMSLLLERELISLELHDEFLATSKDLNVKLNNFITKTRDQS